MIYKFLLAVLLANDPVYFAESKLEFNTLRECVTAIQSVEDQNIRPRLICVAVPVNYI